jgi:hypothetical protein
VRRTVKRAGEEGDTVSVQEKQALSGLVAKERDVSPLQAEPMVAKGGWAGGWAYGTAGGICTGMFANCASGAAVMVAPAYAADMVVS